MPAPGLHSKTYLFSDLTNASMMIIHLCAIWSWICQGGSEITIQVKSPVLASMLVVEMAGGRNRGLYYFQNSSFFIKPDLRDLSFLTGGLMQFFIKCR